MRRSADIEMCAVRVLGEIQTREEGGVGIL